MFVPFEALPDHSRIWIYQSNKKITNAHHDIISEALRAFTQQWKVHGEPMDASFTILFDQFVVLAANDQASGCSIDSSVRAIKQVGEITGLDFFNRNLIAFKKQEEVTLIPLQNLKKGLQEKAWSYDSVVFNNLISTKKELKENWIMPAKDSWLKRYLPSETISESRTN